MANGSDANEISLTNKIEPELVESAKNASSKSAMTCMTFLDSKSWSLFVDQYARSSGEWMAVRLEYCEKDTTKYALFSSERISMPGRLVWRDLSPRLLATQLELWLSCRWFGDVFGSPGPVTEALGVPERKMT